MNFFVVYVKTKRKLDKYIKNNKIKNKYVIDVKKIIEEEEIDLVNDDITKLKILIFNKIQMAVEKNKDIYYIPNFDIEDYSVNKLLNLRKVLSSDSTFNVLIFYNEFRNKKEQGLISDVLTNIDKFTNSQILKDY